jgi:para-nitrobenzyl esterase
MKTMTTIRSGRLAGERSRGCAVFRGVPYASVRPGSGRFREAGPVTPWSGVRSARRRGPAAPQRAFLPPWLRVLSAVPPDGWDEDCLSLEVRTPGCERRGLPVLVFLHGGAFTHGSGGFWVYAGERLAAHGAVVVTPNYRLGAFGNLDLRWLDPATTDTNVGLRDQVAALRWVRDEIEAFGGDPDNVTVLGQSAGAMSIAALMACPVARGLFHRVVLQSGAGRNVHAGDAAQGVAEHLLAELGIEVGGRDAVARLRAASPAALLRAQAAVSLGHRLPLGLLAWQPVVDGDWLPESPLDAVRRGAAPRIPLLIGVTRDEWKMFTATDARRRRLDEPTLRRYLGRSLERDGLDDATDVDEVLSLYAEDPESGRTRTPADVWVAFQGDRVFRRPAVELADAHAAQGADTWFYRFDRAPSVGRERIGACHAIELPFVFGTIRAPLLRAAFAWPPDAVTLSDRMQAAWLAFARAGAPADGAWPRYRAGEGAARVLGGRAKQVEAAPPSLRGLWSRLSSAPPPASIRAAPA